MELDLRSKKIQGRFLLPGSKSESNRLLILRALYAPSLNLKKLSVSSDTKVLQKALKEYPKQTDINIGDAGTAMRFMTAFLASRNEGRWVLDGSKRMRERPIGLLVEALKALGATIDYLEKPNYPPLAIKGKTLSGGNIEIEAGISSQFISALMLIAPGLKDGLSLVMKGFSVSAPYIYLTGNLMRKMGFKVYILGDEVRIPGNQELYQSPREYTIEGDWSAASYWYSLVALAPRAEVYLPGLHQFSLQGDSLVQQYYANLGVGSVFTGPGYRLRKTDLRAARQEINLLGNPDLAQSLAVSYAALNLPVVLKGLQTLSIKETDRLKALKNELSKTGAQVEIGSDFLQISKGIQKVDGLHFKTYGDHRMALALAPLALFGKISIEDPQVIQKSYPHFWEQLAILPSR